MIRTDCRHWRAARPCAPNKLDGSECPDCRHFAPTADRVLFIKLDALGDVLRSASLLPAVIARHDRPRIAWLTRPEAVELVGMMTLVDEAIALDPAGLAQVAAGGWTQVYSLSNDPPSAALATLAAGGGPRPVGFFLEDGRVRPSNAAAERWLELASFDRLKRANTQSYQERMLAILDAPPAFPPPSLRLDPAMQAAAARRVAALLPAGRRRRVAVNLGAGARWPKKMLGPAAIAACVRALQARAAVDVLLVGAAAEQDKAASVLAASGGGAHVQAALTAGSVAAFIATLAEADVLLCGDTLALHAAVAIGLPTVAVFGPTSRAEIAAFDGLVEKVFSPALDCLGCYGDCDKPVNCMSALDPAALAARVLARLRPMPHDPSPAGPAAA
jgi:ADP-heptose:LPS heptosyltransferase